MSKYVASITDCNAWATPGPNSRVFGVLFEPSITPDVNIAVGLVRIPAGQEQTKLSAHESDEVYFVNRGDARFVLGDGEYDAPARTAVYVRKGTRHRAINAGDTELELLFVNSPPIFGNGAEPSIAEMVSTWEKVQG